MLFVTRRMDARPSGNAKFVLCLAATLNSRLRMLAALRAELPTALPRSRVTGIAGAPRASVAASPPLQLARRHATSYSRFGQRQLPGSAGSGAYARWQRLPPRFRMLGVAVGGGGVFYVANLRQVLQGHSVPSDAARFQRRGDTAS